MKLQNQSKDTNENTSDIHYQWHQDVEKDYQVYIKKGGYLVAGVVIFILIWSILAPIKGAAVAVGTVIADGNNSVIQHLEGGIVDTILVKEGQKVNQGQELIYLDNTQSQVEVNRTKFQRDSLLIQEARLLAEINLNDKIYIDDKLTHEGNSIELDENIAREKQQFQARRESFLAERSIIENRISSLREQLYGNNAMLETAKAEIALVRNELKSLEYLYKKQLVTETRITSVRRAVVQLKGQMERGEASIASLGAQLKELEEQAIQVELQYKERASTELNNVKRQLADVEQVLIRAQDTLGRVTIRAPKDGIVFRIPKKTPRAVITPGETVIEILPTSETLIIEAQLNTNDIDLISHGQEAELRFSALSNRNPPIATGHVDFISPDVVLPTEPTQMPYYPVRIKIDDATWPSNIDRSLITPGMNVDTFIITEARSLVSYLLEPITESASFALREP